MGVVLVSETWLGKQTEGIATLGPPWETLVLKVWGVLLGKSAAGVLEKTLESPLDRKEIQTVHSEGDQPWGFFGRNDAKAETPVLWPPHVKS